MCTVLLPLGGNPIAYKYIIIQYSNDWSKASSKTIPPHNAI